MSTSPMTFKAFWFRIRFTGLITSVISVLFTILNFGAQTSLASQPPIQIIIDTDMGVDDAAAVTWLLSQTRYPVEVLGISTVMGNTDVENASNNVLTILDATDHTDIPVVIGASEPSSQTHSHTGTLVHGPDGLWFVGFSNPHDLSDIPTDVVGFYCDTAANNPGATLVTLGPLTNLAQAVAACPNAIQLLGNTIILGGSKTLGNITPISEFNVWQDPEAAYEVLTANLMPTFIPRDTFSTFTLSQDNLDELAEEGTPVAKLLYPALQLYANVQTELGGATAVSMPDVPALMYALDATLGTLETGLVKVVTNISEASPIRLLRGQTIIGLDPSERIPMIADDVELSALADQAFTDPNFDLQLAIDAILAREPENTYIVTNIRERKMRQFFMRALTDD
jgi:inosine-uridine nucleoside N-ribohydrolase